MAGEQIVVIWIKVAVAWHLLNLLNLRKESKMEHWMIYAGIGWVAMGLWACRLWYGLQKNHFHEFDKEDWVRFPICLFLGGIAVPALFCTYGKHCFKEGADKAIYWNEKEGQIMTRGGKCLYDPYAIDKQISNLANMIVGFKERLNKTQTDGPLLTASKFNTLTRQLQCSAKTKDKHKMVYANIVYNPANPRIIFRCLECDLEVYKTKAELTPSEKEALKKLKVL